MAGGQGRSPTLPHTLSCVRTRARTTIMCRPSRQDGCTFGGVHGDSTLSAIKTAFASLCLSAEAPPCLGRLPRVGGIFRARLHYPVFMSIRLAGRRSEVRLGAGGDDRVPLLAWIGMLSTTRYYNPIAWDACALMWQLRTSALSVCGLSCARLVG